MSEDILAKQKKEREEAIAADEKRMAEAQPYPTQEQNDRAKLGLPIEDEDDEDDDDGDDAAPRAARKAPGRKPKAKAKAEPILTTESVTSEDDGTYSNRALTSD
jgi:hypothetical protein